jgi:DNA adenine methylase
MGYGFRSNEYKYGWRNDVHGRDSMYAVRDWISLPDNIIHASERLRRVQIENRPALEVIQRFNFSDVCMYIDPPYVLKTRSGKQYAHEMDTRDHEELLNVLKSSSAKILISGYESELYNEILKDWNCTSFSSHSQSSKARTEFIWYNYDIQENNEQISLKI